MSMGDIYFRYEAIGGMMIKKTKKGYKVVSEKGKALSKDDLTKKEAEKRLKQIEYFKHKKGK